MSSVLVFLLFACEAAAQTPPWYSSGWTNRKAITIDHNRVSGATNLSNFPVLFSVTDANLKTVPNGGHAGKADGTDILFTSSDGVTKLDHEIQFYNAATGQLVSWVRIPSLSPSADAVVYLYYGNASATDQTNRTGVWGSNYKGVWHLSDNAGNTTVTDSSANGNTATNQVFTNLRDAAIINRYVWASLNHLVAPSPN